MSLFRTYGSFNRVVSEELSTKWERETILKEESDVGAAYYKYKRIRSKKYSYIGMTRSAAIACANDLNAMLTRYICPYVWDNDAKYWKRETATNDKLIAVNAGHATPNHEEGDDWSVSVDINEVIVINYRPVSDLQTERLPAPYSVFESNPNVRDNVFRGFEPADLSVDFDYDEGD